MCGCVWLSWCEGEAKNRPSERPMTTPLSLLTARWRGRATHLDPHECACGGRCGCSAGVGFGPSAGGRQGDPFSFGQSWINMKQLET